MAVVDEKEVQAKREEMAVGGILSAQAIESHEAALAHLKSTGLSHDYASEVLRQKGADVVLAEKAAAEPMAEAEPTPAPALAPEPPVSPTPAPMPVDPTSPPVPQEPPSSEPAS